MLKRRVSVLAACVFTLAGGVAALWSPAAPRAFADSAAAPAPRFVPNEVLIQFKPAATPADRADAFARLGLADREHIFTHAMREAGAGGVIRAFTRDSVANAVAALRKLPMVAFAEPNYILTRQDVSNDSYYTGGSLWGMYGDQTNPANQYGSQAGEAWAAGRTGSNQVYVGVIDEGIQYDHPDLAGNVWTNPNDPVNGVDDDGNGYVDDIHGWDFAGNDNSVYDGTSDDHATHVAGTIGARGGNGIGVAGVNWNVTIISAKFLGANGGTTANAVKAVDYITNLKKKFGLNIVATNNSWGGGGYSQSLHDAILRAAKADILFIAAAGNGDFLGRALNNDSTANYPSNYNTTQGTSTESAASYDAVIAVAALTSSGAKASYSNYGKTTVDLGAPGSGIYSTVPSNSYASYSGTSMATPHVTGAAALYASFNPGATALAIRDAILDSARATPTTSLSTNTVTGGRLNIGQMLGTTTPPPPTIPAAPTNLNATAGNSQVALSWTASSGATGYNVKRSTTSGSGYATIGTTSGTSYTDATVSNGTTYYYVITATNTAGESGNSNQASATPTAPVQNPVPSVGSISPPKMTAGGTVSVTISGANFVSGARVTFENGTGPTPTASIVSVSSDTITTSVSVGSGGPRGTRTWDVVVTNPDGQSARLVGGFTVTK